MTVNLRITEVTHTKLRYTGSRSRPSMSSLYVTSTFSVGSSHTTPRDGRKSWNADVLRCCPRRDNLLCGAEAEAPFDGAAKGQPAAEALTNEETRVPLLVDPARPVKRFSEYRLHRHDGRRRHHGHHSPAHVNH
jgi:hypothetical protein